MKTNLLLCLLPGVLLSCGTPESKEYHDTPTSGNISIAVDESFRPIIDSQIATFESIYKNAHISPVYLPESEAFKLFLKDSSRLIVATRELNEEEKKYFQSIQLQPKVTKIAVDAIAFICHNENADTTLSAEQIRAIFSGKIKKWNDLNAASPATDIHIVFDNSLSSTARYIRESMLSGKPFPDNCFALKTNEEVIDYCHTNKDALGLIGVSWISDGDDPASLAFKNKIRVVRIKPDSDPEGLGRGYKPYQAYIAQEYYPYTRNVYIHSREARSGLGNGFTAFVAGDKGQRIILKSGILPAIKPLRIVGFRDNE